MDFTYLKQPNNTYTFTMPKLRSFVAKNCKGEVLNLFAGKIRVVPNEYRVDLDPLMNPDFVGDAFEFINLTDKTFDTVIFDPPYNIRKAREKYNSRWIGKDTKIKNSLVRVMNKDSLFIQLGYNTTGMSKKRGFEIIAICLINHGGSSSDTICIIEQKTNNLFDQN